MPVYSDFYSGKSGTPSATSTNKDIHGYLPSPDQVKNTIRETCESKNWGPSPGKKAMKAKHRKTNKVHDEQDIS
ncbi:hypothetical protein BGX30_000838 [Mortierella sp. GBA39]|nr:hypothetical protein BGX30_000838 [Mortierella sp. GBA39]